MHGIVLAQFIKLDGPYYDQSITSGLFELTRPMEP